MHTVDAVAQDAGEAELGEAIADDDQADDELGPQAEDARAGIDLEAYSTSPSAVGSGPGGSITRCGGTPRWSQAQKSRFDAPPAARVSSVCCSQSGS